MNTEDIAEKFKTLRKLLGEIRWLSEYGRWQDVRDHAWTVSAHLEEIADEVLFYSRPQRSASTSKVAVGPRPDFSAAKNGDCASCRFFVVQNDVAQPNWGYCYGLPPSPKDGRPQVHANEWCGLYECKNAGQGD